MKHAALLGTSITFAAMHYSAVYEPVIGLEIHAQLLTKSKLFCGDSTTFGDPPNTHVSAISLAHPGTLPVLNKEAVRLAVTLGMAFDCSISRENHFARKHYFYPDLPKGYQISQHTAPLCGAGTVPVNFKGKEYSVLLNRIHMEEDAGKSLHDQDTRHSCIDLNRAGTPLVEIVTEPCIPTAELAAEYFNTIRRMVRYLGVSDGNMEEGSLRCDANISVRKKGSTTLGTKVEVKNLNSIRNVKRAIEFEIERLCGLLEKGEEIVQQTRSFDAGTGTTFALRDKEDANDYRYFPEPDLAPFLLSEEYLEAIRAAMPELPHEMEKRMVNEMDISASAASVICDESFTMQLFDAACTHSAHHKAIANWIIGPVKASMNESKTNPAIDPRHIATLADMTEEERLSFAVAAAQIFPLLTNGASADPETLAKEMNLLLVKNSEALRNWVKEVLDSMPDKVEAYKNGKKNLTGLFAGEVKKKSRGKADMKMVNQILNEVLNQ